MADYKTGRKHVLFLTKIDEKLRFHFLMAFLIKLKIFVIVYKWSKLSISSHFLTL